MTGIRFNPRARRGARVAGREHFPDDLKNVSILARAEARALPLTRGEFPGNKSFQSSRAPRRARCAEAQHDTEDATCFNPRARRGARVALTTAGLARAQEVSILARAEARALLR